MAAKQSRLFLKVYTRRGIIFDSEVQSVTSFNDKGKFDVLAEHAQFISMLKDRLVYRLTDGREQIMPVHNAIMRVKGEQVEVFLGVRQ